MVVQNLNINGLKILFVTILVLGVACSSAEDGPATPVPSTAPTSAPAASTVATAVPAAPPRSAFSMIDFISFGGITYLTWRIEKEPPLQEENLGLEFGQVAFKYEGNVSDPSYKLKSGKDGDAAFLEVGTPVYTVKGYKPEFMLAARRNNKLVLYMSDTHPNAETGSDLMDLEGKVKYIGVNSPKDGKTELAAIKDQSQIDTLVRMVLDAPVDQNIRNDLDSDLYFLAFHLKDGITVTRGYRLQSNLLDRGIKLPREFRTAIEDALR